MLIELVPFPWNNSSSVRIFFYSLVHDKLFYYLHFRARSDIPEKRDIKILMPKAGHLGNAGWQVNIYLDVSYLHPFVYYINLILK